ncbi:MAG: tRNA (adenosine(37)-N6)-dimethylallyltransferase MiaA [Spirochaetia bacterium]
MAKIVVLLGPTCVGKTQLVLELADLFSAVIYADTACLYRELNIGSAKPSKAERQSVPHHMIDLLSLEESFNAGQFYHQAQAICKQYAHAPKPILISGGTFFYILNFLFGLSQAPPSTPESRTYWKKQLDLYGTSILHKELLRIDPVSAQRIHATDAYRITRALEVFSDTQCMLSSYQRPKAPRIEHKWLILSLTRERTELYARINDRVDLMWQMGLAQEIQTLIDTRGAHAQMPGMKAIGYREFFLGLQTPQKIKEKIQLSSRHYAKRQITFLQQFPVQATYHAQDLMQIKKTILAWDI